MPYSSVDDLPQAVKDRLKSPKKRRQWLHVWNSSYDKHHDESRAFAEANSVTKAAAGDDFRFFLPIAKVDKEARTVSGYASTECLDLDGEVVSRDAIKAALPGYWQWRNIREMHQPSAVGKAQEANIDEKGLYLTAKIVDDAAWKKVDEGVYNGFSIGGRKLAKTGNVITKVDLVEISVVDRPANPDCRFTVQKAASGEGEKDAEAILLPAADGEEPPAVIEKREFSSEARDRAASTGAAMPDGSFPIENEGDLKNAIRAIGRAKNPKKAKKHIKSRAATLGLSSLIPEEWKMAKSASSPSVAIPDADSRAEAVGDGAKFGHELSLGDGNVSPTDGGGKLSKRERKLLKGLGLAGDLAYCFDRIRSAQRQLMREAQVEGGDKKDTTLASKLGEVARNLAAVIGQKAEHEGQEALDLTDADDRSFSSIYGDEVLAMSVNTNNEPDALSKLVLEAIAKSAGTPTAKPSAGALLKASKKAMKQAKEMRQDVEDCVKGLFEMHKAAYQRRQALVKAGKKPSDNDADDMDHAEAMKMLQKAFGALTNQKAFVKAASDSLKKAARISSEGTVEDGISGVYKVPEGVKTLSPNEMDNLAAAKGAKLVTEEQAALMVKAAKAEAELDLLKRMPAANGSRPYAFDTAKIGMTAGEANPVAEFFKGANPANLTAEDPQIRETEIAKSIGDRILGGAGKSLFDPSFHGTAGAS